MRIFVRLRSRSSLFNTTVLLSGDGRSTMSTDGEVANALVCKTSIHGFKSHSVLQLN